MQCGLLSKFFDHLVLFGIKMMKYKQYRTEPVTHLSISDGRTPSQRRDGTDKLLTS